MAYNPQNPNGQATMANSEPVVLASDQSAIPISGTVTATATNLDIRDLVFATDKVDVSGSTGVGVTGTFWQATQPVSGTVAATQSGTWILGANSGVDIGDITINNASGASAVNIQDGGNSITVDGTVAFSNSTIAVTNAGTFVVQENGAALTALQLIDDTVVAQSTALGTTKNSLIGGSVTTAAPTYTTGNINPLSLTVAGALRVDNSGVTQPVSGTVAATQSGTWNIGTVTTVTTTSTLTNITNWGNIVDNAQFTDGTTRLLMTGFIYDEVAGTALTENDAAAGRINVNRAQVQVFEDGATRGRYATVTASNALKVDGSAVTQPVSLTSTTITGTVAVTQSGTWILGANSGVDIGDVTINNAAGASAVNIQDGGNTITVDGTVAISGTVPVSATDLDIRNLVFATDKVDISGSTVIAAGDVAHDSSDSGNPVKIGGYASASVPTVVGIGDRVNAWYGLHGEAVVTILANGTTDGSDGTFVRELNAPGGTVSNPIPTAGWYFNGATWDKVRGNLTDGLLVNLGANNDVTVTSISAGTNYIGKVRLTDGTTDGEVVPLAGYNAQAVALVDGSGNQITSFGGGVQYTEGDVDATITGTALMWEDTSDTLRAVSVAKPLPVNFTNTTIATTNAGTFAVQLTGATNNINNISGTVSLPTGAATETTLLVASGALEDIYALISPMIYREDDPAAANPDGYASILVRADTPATVTTTDGDNVAQRGTNYGAAYVTLLDTGGSPVSVGGGTQYTEDAVSAANPIGTMLIGVVDTGKDDVVSGDGDNMAARMSINGELYTLATIATTTESGQSVLFNIGGFEDAFNTVLKDNNGGLLQIAGIGGPPGPLTGIHAFGFDGSDSAPLSINASGHLNVVLQAGTNYAGKVRLTDGTTDAEVVPLAGFNAQAVAIVDAAGAQITSFGGGTQYTEADTDATITGTAILWEDTSDTLRAVSVAKPLPVNFTNTTIAVTNAGIFPVQIDGAALTSLQLADDVVYTDDTSTHATGTSKGTGIMAVANPTDAAVDANDIGMVAMTLARALKNDITTIAGTAPTTAGFIDIKGADGNVFVRQAIAANLNMTEASASGILTAVQLIDDTVVAQGTALGTTKNSLIGGSVTTAAPSYTTGQISPLSLTLTGALRVDSGVTAYTEDVAAAADPVGGMMIGVVDTGNDDTVSGDGDNMAVRLNANGAQYTSQAPQVWPAAVAMQTAAAANGNGTLMDVRGYNTAILTIIGASTPAMTVNFEGSMDDSVWFVVQSQSVLTDFNSGSAVTPSTGTIPYRINTQGLKSIRARISSYVSGNATVVGYRQPIGSTTMSAVVQTTIASGPLNVQIDGGLGVFSGVFDETGATAINALGVGGGTPHDEVDSGNPIKIGGKAIAHGTNPTAVAAADRSHIYTNRAGIPFVIGGHPNILSAEYFTSGAQTDDPVIAVVSAGTKIVVTSITVSCSAANATSPSVRIGFGTASVPTQGSSGADGVAKVILSHPGIAAGSGIVKGNGAGIVGIGGDGDDLRITCTTPTTSLIVQVDYYTIES